MSANPTPTPRARRTGWIVAATAAGALVAGTAYGVQEATETKTARHIQLAAVGWKHTGHARFSELSETEKAARITRFVRHVSIEIDATPAQEKKIIAMVVALANDVAPMRKVMHETRDELHKLLTADKIDRVRLEAIRAARMAEVEKISKTLVATVADVAEVLTPEQRRTLEKRVRELRSMFGGRRHWRHRGHKH